MGFHSISFCCFIPFVSFNYYIHNGILHAKSSLFPRVISLFSFCIHIFRKTPTFAMAKSVTNDSFHVVHLVILKILNLFRGYQEYDTLYIVICRLFLHAMFTIVNVRSYMDVACTLGPYNNILVSLITLSNPETVYSYCSYVKCSHNSESLMILHV